MDPVYLPPQVFGLDPFQPFALGIDYAWDAEGNTVRRLPGGGIGDGEGVLVLQDAEVQSALLTALAEGRAVVLDAARVRLRAMHDWDAEAPVIEALSDLAWSVELAQQLASAPARATVSGPLALEEAISEWSGEQPQPLIEIAVEFAPDVFLVVFEGFIEAVDRRANEAGQVRVSLALTDPLLRLEPPYTPLEKRQWGRTLIFEPQGPPPDPAPPGGFGIQPIGDRLVGVEIPTAHQILREVFEERQDDYFRELALGMLDFPVPYYSGAGKSPLAVFAELARLAGATVSAEGRVLVVRELASPDQRVSARFIYPRSALQRFSAIAADAEEFTAVQVFGHSETGAVPLGPQGLVPPPDPSQPGYARLGETEGVIEPVEPIQTVTPPPDILLTFTFNATLYDPATLIVDGAERIGAPSFYQEGLILWATIELALPWVVTDLSGEAPFTLDEEGNPRFFLAGQVVDALSIEEGAPLGIPYPTVTRELMEGGEPTGEEVTLLGNAQGFYRFTDVPLGVYRIRAIAPGYFENWSDTDPANNTIRDLQAEYEAWLEGQEDGRYRKEPTPYHITIWGKLYVPQGEVGDLTLQQVRVEVRRAEVPAQELRYAPAIRDERLTTERLAIRAGQMVLWASLEASRRSALVAAANPLSRPGDRYVVRDGEAEQRFTCGSLRRRWSHDLPATAEESAALSEGAARRVLPAVLEDPLDTRIGTVVAIGQNQFGQRVVDVEVEGILEPGLGVNPLLGEVRVGEVVQVAKWYPGALQRMVVARAAAVFGPWRVAEVEVE